MCGIKAKDETGLGFIDMKPIEEVVVIMCACSQTNLLAGEGPPILARQTSPAPG